MLHQRPGQCRLQMQPTEWTTLSATLPQRTLQRHKKTFVGPGRAPYCPAGHSVHAVAPLVLLNRPGGQGAPEAAVIPTPQYDPKAAEHGRHDELLTTAEYVPTGQKTQVLFTEYLTTEHAYT